jgi:hypothetical protein
VDLLCVDKLTLRTKAEAPDEEAES